MKQNLTKKEWNELALSYMNHSLNPKGEYSLKQVTADALRAIMIMIYLPNKK